VEEIGGEERGGFDEHPKKVRRFERGLAGVDVHLESEERGREGVGRARGEVEIQERGRERKRRLPCHHHPRILPRRRNF